MEQGLVSSQTGGALEGGRTDSDGSDSDMQKRSAKNVMTSVISQQLYSIPGYHILEDYKDRICTSLPDDYNNTAMRLQTLIGASDHMIQWILTGDMSQVNHRIYQVVLVYVCFQPHFIKFCDIMEVLVADSVSIIELRKALIRQLYANKHITAEEASRLTSSKLFKMPSPPSTDTLPITLNTTGNSVHNGIFQMTSNFYSPASSIMHSSTDTSQKVFLASTREETSWPTSQRHSNASSTASLPVTLKTNANSVDDNVCQVSTNSYGPAVYSITHNTATVDQESFPASTEANSDTVLTHQCQLELQLVLELPPTIMVANSIPPASHEPPPTSHDPTLASHDLPPASHDPHICNTEDQHAITMNITSDPLPSDQVQKDDDCNSVSTEVADEEVMSSATTYQTQDGCHSVANEPMLNLTAPSECKSSTVEEKALTQSNVNTAGSSDAQLSGCQEQQADVTEIIPDANSSDNNISVPCSTDANAGISSDDVPTPHSNLEASPSLLENAAGGSTANTTRVSSSERPPITTVPAKASSGGRPSISSLATLKLDSTPSSDENTTHPITLTQDGPKASDELEIIQLIDFLMDNDILKYENVVNLCLMPSSARNALLKSAAETTEGLTDAAKAHSLRQSGSVGMDLLVNETLLEEVRKVLEIEDFAIVKSKYAEMIACLPEDYETTIVSLQSYLTDSEICEILSMTSNHNQKTLNYLILKLKSKEDLLDFCDCLENVKEAHPVLQLIIQQIKKEAMAMIHTGAEDSKQEDATKKEDTKRNTIVTPPKMDFSLYPTLLVTPREAFTCSLPDDSEGLAAMIKFYPLLIENLPSNHLISLLRLQGITYVPEAIADIIVPSSSAEIGNKMIINYLIGLIHTEEHIITFCRCVKIMTGEFEKCIAVLNLQNLILKIYGFEEKCPSSEIIGIPSTEGFTGSVKLAPPNNALPSPETAAINGGKDTDSSVSVTSRKEIGQNPSITTLLKPIEDLPCFKPCVVDNRTMLGFSQCILITSYGGNYTNTIKATTMGMPSQPLAKETSPANDVDKESDKVEEHAVTVESVIKDSFTDKQTITKDPHSVALSMVNQDVKTMKGYIGKDLLKEYAFSLHDQPHTQSSKQFYLDSIETLFRECSKAGAWIYYTGYAEKGTGNWCFKDGTISFREIFDLYKKFLRGKLLYLYSDCCYAGNWVVECAKCLDEMGIGACGHQTIEEGMLFKVFTSCQPNQKAMLQRFVKEAISFYDDSIHCYIIKEFSNSQIAYGCDFTQTMCMQTKGLSASCQLPDIPSQCAWKWVDIVSIDSTKRPADRVKLVRGTDRGREVWQYVLVEKELEENFSEATATGPVDVSDYGYLIQQGWGKDPPKDYSDSLQRCLPQYY